MVSIGTPASSVMRLGICGGVHFMDDKKHTRPQVHEGELLEAGVPMETICKMLDHKDVKMTQRYARVTQKKLFEDMDKFIAATGKDFILAL